MSAETQQRTLVFGSVYFYNSRRHLNISHSSFDRRSTELTPRSQDERIVDGFRQKKTLMVSQFILSLPKGTMR